MRLQQPNFCFYSNNIIEVPNDTDFPYLQSPSKDIEEDALLTMLKCWTIAYNVKISIEKKRNSSLFPTDQKIMLKCFPPHKYQLEERKQNAFCYDHILQTTDFAYTQKNQKCK